MNIYSIIILIISFCLGGFFSKLYYQEPVHQNIKIQDIRKQQAFDIVRKPLQNIKKDIETKEEDKKLNFTIPSFIKDTLALYDIDILSLSNKKWEEFLEKYTKKTMDKNIGILFNDSSLLHLLVKEDYISFSKLVFLLKQGYDINTKNKSGKTPLSIALENKTISLTTIKKMLELGAILDDDVMLSLLKNKNTYAKDEIMQYLKESGLSFKDSKFIHVLLYKENDIYLQEYLETEDLNVQIDNTFNLFEKILLSNKNNDLAEYMLEKAVDIQNNSEGFNVLHASMRNNFIDIDNIDKMIKAGANVNATIPKVNMTPLMYAINQKNETNQRKLQKIELLLKNGADTNIVDRLGRSSYEYVNKIEDEKLQEQIIKLLNKNYDK